MTAADPFTRADARWINAQRLGGRTGAAFEVSNRRSSWPLVILGAIVAAGIYWVIR